MMPSPRRPPRPPTAPASELHHGEPQTVRCHACNGRFGFGFDGEKPIAYHSAPFCVAFDAIETAADALRFAERCDLAIKPS